MIKLTPYVLTLLARSDERKALIQWRKATAERQRLEEAERLRRRLFKEAKAQLQYRNALLAA